MTVDHRPLLARKAPLIRRALYVGLIVCGLSGGCLGAAVAVHYTTPKEK